MKVLKYGCALVSLAALVGCGTITTAQIAREHGENIKPYSGTRLGMETPVMAGHGVIIPMFLDIPFSLVADTLILPVVLFQTTQNTMVCQLEQGTYESERNYYALTLTIRGQEISKIAYERSTNSGGALGLYEHCDFRMLSNSMDSKWERRENMTVVEFGNRTPRSQIVIERLLNGYRVDFSQADAMELCDYRAKHPKAIRIESGQALCRMDQ